MADKDFRVKNGIHVGTDVFISNAITRVNTVNFATNGFSGGNLTWNTSDGTLDINLGYGDVVLQTGQETHYVVRNATGSTILNGTSVYCDGVTEGSGRFTANLMLGDGSISPVQYLGLATHDINNGVNGIVTHFGYVRGLDTRGTANTALSVGDENWSVGDKLYVHPTAPGKLTKVEPEAPNAKICVAVVIIRNQSNGKLFVRPTTNLTLDKLSDVQLNTIADGQTIIWNSANSRFENAGLIGDVSNTWVNANDYITYTTLETQINNVAENVASIASSIVTKGSIVANADVLTTLDSYSSTIFRTSKYLVEATTNSEYYVTDLFVTHMSNNAITLEANTLKSPTLGIQLGATMGDNVVNVTIQANADVAVKFSRSSIMRDSNDIPELVIEGDLMALNGFEDLNEGRGFIDLQ
jgi:hypothetical protein